MSIELRILTGARAGQTETFEQPRITFGRHPSNDFRLDAHADLNVSTRHGEIFRGGDGGYVVRDSNSTNGTFVNGERLAPGGERALRDGDTIMFGAQGPQASVRIERGAPAASQPRQRTSQRVARAVAHQTRGLKIAIALSVVVLGGLGAAAYWAGHSEARAADAKLTALMASYDSSSRQLQARVESMNDTALVHRLERQKDSLVRVVRAARGAEAVAAQQSLKRHQDAAREIGRMDLPSVHAANDAAVTLIRTNLGQGGGLEATGFSVSTRGLVVTNRHVVADGGARASQITLKFANTDAWRPAHLVRMPRDTSVDLALVQLDDERAVPAVAGIAPRIDVPVGGAVASLGFPDGSDLPMDGAKAKTTLTLGTLSKLTDDLLQIDSYASHGSSGSPVFDGHGHVIGVVFGGAPGSGGRIVYAVPANRIAELLKASK